MTVFSVPLSKDDNHPCIVLIGPNAAMGCWDIQIAIGNYKTRADAETEAAAIKEALERAINMDFGAGRVQ